MNEAKLELKNVYK